MPTHENTGYRTEWWVREPYYTEQEVTDAITRNTRGVPDNVTDLEEERVKRTTGGAKAWTIKVEPEGGTA